MSPLWHIESLTEAHFSEVDQLAAASALSVSLVRDGLPGNSLAALALATTPPSAESLWPNCVGFCLAQVLADELEITDVCSAPEHRRRGVARSLLLWTFALAVRRGSRQVHLEVRAKNEGAIALYRSLGFELSGLRKGYYRDGEDALLFSRLLSERGAAD